MYKLSFENRFGEEREVAQVADWTEANLKIMEFIKNLNPDFKVYYMRAWEENGRTKVDVGSWIEFFFIEPAINI